MKETRIRLLPMLMMLAICCTADCNAQTGDADALQTIGSVWGNVRQGRINEAMSTAKAMLENDASNSEARHVYILSSFLTGRYEECLAHYGLLDRNYEKYDKLNDVILNAYDHLNRIEEAAGFARSIDRSDSVCNWLDRRSKFPIQVRLDKVTILPFAPDNPIKEIMPAVWVDINGKKLLAHLDTGGKFLAISPSMARELGVEYQAVAAGVANMQETIISMGIVPVAKLGAAEITNLPTAVIPALEGVLRGQDPESMVIIGTNVFEQFLTTWDHGNMRLILSPRGHNALREEHMKLIPSTQVEVDFYTLSDHWLASHARVGNAENLLFLFDTGLGIMDPQGRQPALAMTAPDLVRLGFDEAEVERQFVECPKISMSTAISTGHVILVKKDQDFPDWRGRLDICGNMSWGLMKTFVWTMDFDNNKWLLSNVEAGGASTADVAKVAPEDLRALVGTYELAPGVAADITTDDVALYIQLTGQPKNAIIAQDALTYVLRAAGAKIVFAKDDSGKATHFTLFQGGRETKANRTK